MYPLQFESVCFHGGIENNVWQNYSIVVKFRNSCIVRMHNSEDVDHLYQRKTYVV